MQLFSGSQIIDSRCSITLDFDSYSIQDHRTGAMLGASSQRHDGLWELDWLCLPSDTTVASSSASIAVATSSFQQWHHRLGYLYGSRLLYLVHRGVLGSVSEYASLDCLGCRLGKQI
jgi:hypothetical protein